MITQAQAEQITANSQAFPFDGHWGGWLSQNGIDFEARLAAALGITVDMLQADLDGRRGDGLGWACFTVACSKGTIPSNH